jgi:hypothetical protein
MAHRRGVDIIPVTDKRLSEAGLTADPRITHREKIKKSEEENANETTSAQFGSQIYKNLLVCRTDHHRYRAYPVFSLQYKRCGVGDMEPVHGSAETDRDRRHHKLSAASCSEKAGDIL